MSLVFKCFIAVAVVSGYILNTKAMGLCGFQRRFHDKIPIASDCNGKSTFEASTEFSCPHNMVNVSFVNENCTKRCVCNSTGRLTCSDYSCGDNSRCGVEDGVRGCYCHDGFIKREQDCSRPSDCHELYLDGIRDSGTYTVYPPDWPNSSMRVYCNMGDRRQGGWTVFQRRVNGSVDFYRNWTEYRNGFGSFDHEFWLGNEALYFLTNQIDYQLLIDLTYDDGYYNVLYGGFRIGNEQVGYKLITPGIFQTGGLVDYDNVKDHRNAPFSTYDRDLDLKGSENCAVTNHGGWWFTNCGPSYLNGVYGESSVQGIRWYNRREGTYNITSTEMKIRPVD